MRKGKGEMRVRYRLSPNEVDQISKEETDRRRKLRLIQVREQSKVNAAKIRNDVKTEKAKQINKLACEIKNNMEKEKMEKLRKLEQQYENTLKNIGSAHRAARNVNDSQVEQMRVDQQQKDAANDRYKAAIKIMRREKTLQDYQDNKHIISRKAALETEMLRAEEVASRPVPPPDPIELALRDKPKPVPMVDVNAFSTTHYHMPDYAVVKAGPCEQSDARESAEDEDYRLKLELKEKHQMDHDRIVRARIRGKVALRKEHIRHEYDNILQDLSLLQRADRRRRQEEVADLPKQVFVPPDRRLEAKETKQRDMEKAFEDMYIADKHPAVLMNLDKVPSTPDTTDSDIGSVNNQPSNAYDAAGGGDANMQDTGSKVDSKNETALMKLFNRIKEQKQVHATRSMNETSVLGEMPTATQPIVHQLYSGTNGESPLSEMSLPACRNNNAGVAQLLTELKSPDVALPREALVGDIMQTPENMTEGERTAWQAKLKQLEARQNQLDSLIDKFKDMTGMTEDNGHPLPQPLTNSVILPAQRTGQTAETILESIPQLHDPARRDMIDPPISRTSYPSGIYHAKPVNITHKGDIVGGLESGYYTGVPSYLGGEFVPTARATYPTSVKRGTESMTASLPARDASELTSLARMKSHTRSLAEQADHVRRVREYQEKIIQNSHRDLSIGSFHHSSLSSLGSSTDSDLAKKVKAYQEKILAGDADRRQFLAQTRADIELQRENLYRKYPLTMMDTDGASLPLSKPLFEDILTDSLGGRILAEIQDPYRPRSLDIIDFPVVDDEAVVSGNIDQAPKPVDKLSTSQLSSNSSKSKLERVRKSLLFDDPEESLTRTPGHDFSLLAASDIGDEDTTLTSSSERGSPNLSKFLKPDGGVSLLHRAQEHGNVFERRQQELQFQLEEVQRQKEQILQRYQLGQQRIQDSRSVLQSKLDQSSSSASWRSILADTRDSASNPSESSFRPTNSDNLLTSLQPINSSANAFSLLEFPKTLEQFPLLYSLNAGNTGSSFSRLHNSAIGKSLTPEGSRMTSEIEEESLSPVSSNLLPTALFEVEEQSNGNSGESASIEEESLSPYSGITSSGVNHSIDRGVTWAALLSGVPTLSTAENNSDLREAEHAPHDLSTIFEVDTPTTTTTRTSEQYLGLVSASLLS